MRKVQKEDHVSGGEISHVVVHMPLMMDRLGQNKEMPLTARKVIGKERRQRKFDDSEGKGGKKSLPSASLPPGKGKSGAKEQLAIADGSVEEDSQH